VEGAGALGVVVVCQELGRTGHVELCVGIGVDVVRALPFRALRMRFVGVVV
jgi:hypothetical protein